MSTARQQAALILLALILQADSAWAVQTHSGIEGLVSHQIGHFLFATGMAYLLVRLRLMRKTASGWREFKICIWLLIAWNVTTFSGHWMNELVADDKFIKSQASTLSFTIETFSDAIYYLTRLDHLLLVPSFAFLLLALRKWRLSP